MWNMLNMLGVKYAQASLAKGLRWQACHCLVQKQASHYLIQIVSLNLCLQVKSAKTSQFPLF